MLYYIALFVLPDYVFLREMASDTEWNDVDLERVNALLQWIHSLSFEGAEDVDIEALRCGGPFGRILKMVDNTFFGNEWVAEITRYKEDANWRLKENILRKVYNRLSDYVHDHMREYDFDSQKWNIDFEQTARPNGGLHGLLRLLQLTVGVAFTGPNNTLFVSNVNGLSSQVQLAIKNSLEEVQMCTRDETQSPKPLEMDHEESRVTVNHPRVSTTVLDEAEDTMKSLSEELESMKGKVGEKEEVIKKMERKMNEYQERKAEEIKEIRQKLSDREIAFTELEYEKTMLSEESRRLKEEIGELRTRLSESSRLDEERFRREKSDLTDEVVHLKEKNEQLENRVRDCKEHMNQLKVEEQKNNAYRAQLIELDSGKETVKNLKQNIGSLQLTIEENHRDMETLRAERDLAVTDRLELSDKLSVMEEEKRQLTFNLTRATHQFHNGNGLDRKPSLVEELASVAGDSHHQDEVKKELMAVKAHNRELEEELEKRRGAEEEVRTLMTKCAEMTNAAVKMKMDQKEMEEKDLRIRELSVALERMKVQHEQETRLITSAVYEIGLQRLSGVSEREAVTDRSGGSSSRSFLRRQTQENAFNLSVLAWFVMGVMVVLGVIYSLPPSDALTHFINRRQIPLYV